MRFYNIKIEQYLVVIMLMISGLASAQLQTVSPYSRFGLGDPANTEFQHLRAMGGVTGAFYDAYQTNLANPASLAFLTATTYEIGAFAQYSKLTEGDLESENWTGNLSQVSLSFPVFNPISDLLNRKERKIKWGMNLSIVPYTRVGYDIETVDSSDVDLGKLNYRFQGTGGSYKLQWGNGFKYKGLAAGFKTYYLFGRNQLDRTVSFDDVINSNNNRFTNEFTYNGFGIDLGLIYSIDLGTKTSEDKKKEEKRTLSAGVYWSPSTGITTKSEQFYRTVNSSTPGSAIDTLIYTEDPLKGSATLPGQFGGGLFFTSGDCWRVGASYELQQWSKYNNEATGEETDALKDAWSLRLGDAFRPNINSYDHFFHRLNYKAGFRYGTDPRTINGEQLNNYAVSAGVTMPFFFQRQISFVDLGAEWGKRTVTGGINEQYWTILLGFTLNDNDWFIKRKFN